MSTLTQFLGGKPRRQIVTLTASNASLAIPAWAQGGKGIVYVTGCGGGASGAISVTTGNRGGGGQAGGFAINHAILIPSGQATCNAQIGAAGSAVSSGSAVVGNNGGATTLTIGSTVLRLEGGNGGSGVIGVSRGLAYMGAATVAGNVENGPPFGNALTSGTNTQALSRGLFHPASTLGVGATGGSGTTANDGFGAGGHSLFGAGGAGLAAGPSANTNGADATGYGAGGAGALWLSGGNATSGAGSPGLLILEFVEGV